MSQKIVALVGISGVGKTAFLKRIATKCDFQHLTAGFLIARAKKAHVAARDSLRLDNLNENQRLLVQGFAEARDPDAAIVVLDGHVVVHGPAGLSSIDSKVFADLGIDLIAHLEADPSQILANREGDPSRDRPLLSVDELNTHQAQSIEQAGRISADLGINLKRLSHADAETFSQFLSELG